MRNSNNTTTSPAPLRETNSAPAAAAAAPAPLLLTEFETGMVSLGISLASAFSLPKSIGAIYGLAYASVEPLALDEFAERLQIALGSASQGLRFLQRMGAVKPVHLPGNRKTLYAPEESVRRLLIGVLTENFIPRLRETSEQLPDLRARLTEVADPDQREVLQKRMDNLESWATKSGSLLPWLSKFLSGPLSKQGSL